MHICANTSQYHVSKTNKFKFNAATKRETYHTDRKLLRKRLNCRFCEKLVTF